MNDDFVVQVMAQVRISASLNSIPFTSADYARIASVLDFEAVTALERAGDDELAWIGEGQAEARRATYGY